jgi:hypothetical protein
VEGSCEQGNEPSHLSQMPKSKMHGALPASHVWAFTGTRITLPLDLFYYTDTYQVFPRQRPHNTKNSSHQYADMRRIYLRYSVQYVKFYQALSLLLGLIYRSKLVCQNIFTIKGKNRAQCIVCFSTDSVQVAGVMV